MWTIYWTNETAERLSEIAKSLPSTPKISSAGMIHGAYSSHTNKKTRDLFTRLGAIHTQHISIPKRAGGQQFKIEFGFQSLKQPRAFPNHHGIDHNPQFVE